MPNPDRSPTHIFDNAGQPTPKRFAGLTMACDDATLRHLTDAASARVGDAWRWGLAADPSPSGSQTVSVPMGTCSHRYRYAIFG
jgi:hypothetical protein